MFGKEKYFKKYYLRGVLVLAKNDRSAMEEVHAEHRAAGVRHSQWPCPCLFEGLYAQKGTLASKQSQSLQG